ncbi:hypothetical protein BOTBODRAFT_169746 [Botryobasidium botryosum FD-172 SS1]|uniref:F-box domain-containing protein n=1 Tax=Botryobasidium botryosum (strain FD-172 SS1) TaxID=930990 RepID=A0A067NAD2_BOTB1|nr:hypothetical protein BOTBODRAFT_169746 [Botryobasidium botryosum FD-172 SS1]
MSRIQISGGDDGQRSKRPLTASPVCNTHDPAALNAQQSPDFSSKKRSRQATSSSVQRIPENRKVKPEANNICARRSRTLPIAKITYITAIGMAHSTKTLADIHNHVDTLLHAFQNIRDSLGVISELGPCTNETHIARSFACQDTSIANAIHQLKRVIPSLATPVDEIRSSFSVLNERCNAVVPINQLPNEILISIFNLLRRPEYAVRLRLSWTYNEPYAISGIVRASRVCKHWRNIAFETPGLWDRVEIRNSAYAVAKLCVKRSRDVPLIVDMRGDWDADAVAEAVGPSAPRWKDLSLECLESARADHLISRFNTECDGSPLPPLLRAFTLWRENRAFERYDGLGPPEEITCLPLASQLRSLIIKSVPFPSVTSTCTRLTSLSISHTQIAAPLLHSVLLACTQLHTLHLSQVLYGAPTNFSPFVPATLPHLHDLKVEHTASEISDRVFSCVRAPALHTLSIGGPYLTDKGNTHGQSMHPLAQFTERHASIQILAISTPLGKTALDASAALPHVRTLILEDCAMNPNHFRHYLHEIPIHAFPQISELRVKLLYQFLPAVQQFVHTRAQAQKEAPRLTLYLTCLGERGNRKVVEQVRAWLAENTQLKLWNCPSVKNDFRYSAVPMSEAESIIF